MWPRVNPREVLRLLIKRLEPVVASASTRDFESPAGLELAQRGIMHFAEALQDADAALKSGDAKRIGDAARACQALERTGRDMADRHAAAAREAEAQAASAAREAEAQAAAAAARAAEEQARRDARTLVSRRGGDARGAQQSARADDDWRPYQKRYDELIAEGKTRSAALRTVKRAMTDGEFTLRATGERPSNRTISDRLK